MDHAGGVAFFVATRELYRLPPPTIFVPEDNAADFRALLDVWRRLDRSDLACTIVGVGPGDRIDLGRGRCAVPFRSPHRVVCQGYALVSTRQRLDPEFADRDPGQLQELRRAGVTLTRPVEVVELAFTGDTSPEVLEREEIVRAARVLVMECTFLGDEIPPAQAREKGHVHVADLAARAHLLQNEHILLTHFSGRYSPAFIAEEVDRVLPPELRARVTILPNRVPSGA
jgi:ribonuclease Z